jgi:hypothetical protein
VLCFGGGTAAWNRAARRISPISAVSCNLGVVLLLKRREVHRSGRDGDSSHRPYAMSRYGGIGADRQTRQSWTGVEEGGSMRLRGRLWRPKMSKQGPVRQEADPAASMDCAKRPRNPADIGWPSGLYRDAFEDPHRAAHILQLLLSSQTWVHRRVEAVMFHDGTTATRKVSVDFTLPSQAPTCAVCARWPHANGNHPESDSTAPSALELAPRLVPITLLPKRSLINFDLRDESGAALPHLELRQNQDLTFALLCIWAQHVLATPPVASHITTTANGEHRLPGLVELDDEVTKTLCLFTFGDREEFQTALKRLRNRDEPNVQLRQLAKDLRFGYVLGLLTYDFMLIVEVPDKLPYRHVYKVSYDTSFRPKHLTKPYSNGAGAWQTRLRNWSQKRLTAFGWRDTSFEFDTPEAKLAQSYHLKVKVPESVEISKAVLLAGQNEPIAASGSEQESPKEPPNPPQKESFHLDTAGGRPMVDLHVVEVTPDESARARVDLKAKRSGWLGSACLAGLLAFAALFLVSRQTGALPPTTELDRDALTLLATTLVGLSALLATMLTRPNEHPMASDLLYLLRPLSSLAMLMPFVAAAVLVFAPNPSQGLAAWTLRLITMLSGLFAVVLVVAWLRARRRRLSTDSPWQQDLPDDARDQLEHSERPLSRQAEKPPANYQEAWKRYKFGRPAVQTETRRDQPPLSSPQTEAAELVKRFDHAGCPDRLTGAEPKAPTNSPPTRA